MPMQANREATRGSDRRGVDWFTGLHERGAFEQCLREETRHAATRVRPLSLMIVHIDDFDFLRRHLGDATTNACAQVIAETITRTVQRVGMFTARLDAGEFGLILPATDARSVALLGNNIAHAVREVGLRNPRGRGTSVSVSVGVATSNGHFDLDGQALWVVADQAASRARAQGGGRVATSAE